MKRVTSLVLGGLAGIVLGCSQGEKFTVSIVVDDKSGITEDIGCVARPDKQILFVVAGAEIYGREIHGRYEPGKSLQWDTSAPPSRSDAMFKACLNQYQKIAEENGLPKIPSPY